MELYDSPVVVLLGFVKVIAGDLDVAVECQRSLHPPRSDVDGGNAGLKIIGAI